MSDVELTVILPEQMVEEARALGLLSNEALLRLIEAEIARLDHEAEMAWEASLHSMPFAEAFHEDGTIDYEKLKADLVDFSWDAFEPDQRQHADSGKYARRLWNRQVVRKRGFEP
ncbi:MAG: hypothetical protein SF162_12190 [bacterium]|nr:hypothetical protein [bacterium]